MTDYIHRKNIRLQKGVYTGRRPYFITLRTKNSKDHFLNTKLSEFVISQMIETFPAEGISVFAYYLIPDHLHLLIGSEKEVDIVAAISSFKQQTGYRTKRLFGTELWQKRFYDRILRKTDDIQEVARYIFNNPVRKGLVEDFKDYPYSGSLVYSL